jgi:hypothetical protein
MALERVELLAAIKQVLTLSLAKIANQHTKGVEQIKWARLVIQAVTAGTRVLKDCQLEDLELRLQTLEETNKY